MTCNRGRIVHSPPHLYATFCRQCAALLLVCELFVEGVIENFRGLSLMLPQTKLYSPAYKLLNHCITSLICF